MLTASYRLNCLIHERSLGLSILAKSLVVERLKPISLNTGTEKFRSLVLLILVAMKKYMFLLVSDPSRRLA